MEGIDPERLALLPVNVGLCKAPDRMRYKALLARRQSKIECVKKVAFRNCSEFYHRSLYFSKNRELRKR